jgi:hypothetical protein
MQDDARDGREKDALLLARKRNPAAHSQIFEPRQSNTTFSPAKDLRI